jgi:hypothetical protein
MGFQGTVLRCELSAFLDAGRDVHAVVDHVASSNPCRVLQERAEGVIMHPVSEGQPKGGMHDRLQARPAQRSR